MSRGRRVGRLGIAAAGAALMLAACGPVKKAPHQLQTLLFACTGGVQSWVVPAGVTQAGFDLYGVQGGTAPSPLHEGGKGGRATAGIAVTPGESIQVNVGCAGQNAVGGTGGSGGFNGGNFGGDSTGGDGGGGGGATTDPDPCCNGPGDAGGIGAFPVGDTGGAGVGGGGGSQSAGGICPSTCTDGAAGTGGMGGSFGGGGFGDGGGGGGGLFGGGGAGTRGGGGGGSSTGPSGTTYQDGVRIGPGTVVIAYTA